MGNAGILTAIGAIVAVGLLGVLYYCSTLAKNVYSIKVQMKDDLAYEVGKMQKFVEKEMAQRQKWIMRDLESMSGGGDASEEVQALRQEVRLELASLKEKMKKIAALQQAMAAKQKPKPQQQPQQPAMEPVFKAGGPGKSASG